VIVEAGGQANRGMRQGSISLTGSETSLGMLSDSCIEITSSPSSREASVERT
jgi:hypothetical protein